MIGLQRNQMRFFSIDMESSDANLLVKILKEKSLHCLGDGRVEIQRRLSDYGTQIIRYALDGADLFAEEDFAELCIALTRAKAWQVSHHPKHWDRHGQVVVSLEFADGGQQSWISRDWRVAPDAPRINLLRQSLRRIAPGGCEEAALD